MEEYKKPLEKGSSKKEKKYMLDNKGFDLWADGYDKTVGISDEENCYPFAGYKEILGMIYKKTNY